jgi:serine protease Do
MPMYEYYNNDYRSRKKSITLSVKSMIAVCILCGFIGGGMSLVGFNVFNKDVDSGNAFLGATETHDKSQSQNTKNITNISVESVTSYANAVAKKVLPSIVGINVTTKVVNKGWFGDTVTEKVGEGSGIIYKEDGYIITNYHVVQDSITTAGEMNPDSQIKVHLYEDPETGIDARVIGYDIASDLAVIKIEKDNLTAIEIGDSDKVEVGDIVLALGNPGGLKFLGSVSQGIISGLNRSVEVDGVYKDLTLIQTDAAINPGNSGGALVDVEGRLIGVNSVKLAATGYEGMGFAIPVNDVVRIIESLIENGNAVYTYLGITEDTRYTAELLETNGYPGGVVVGSVANGSPAEKAGIKTYDIIVEFNGIKVRTMQELQNIKSSLRKGDVVNIKVFRQTSLFRGDYITFDVTLA